MSENRTKLSFRPGVIAGEKTSPPTGLLINHGKPNFTISRTIKKTNFESSNDSKSEYFGTINRRAMLKKTPSHEGFKKEENGERTETMNRRILLKKTPSNGVLKKEEDEERIEFLQAHKKISEKLSKESIENSIETREEVNNNTSTLRIRSNKEQHFVQIQNGRFNSAGIVNNDLQNSEMVPPKVNGCFKPALPEKPAALQNYKPTSPTGFNVNTNIPAFKKSTVSSSVVSPVQNGVNFEQKTFVSFSKDLSSEPNKYPETVKITKPADQHTEAKDRVIEELTKLKFEIESNGEVVMPVVRNQ